MVLSKTVKSLHDGLCPMNECLDVFSDVITKEDLSSLASLTNIYVERSDPSVGR